MNKTQKQNQNLKKQKENLNVEVPVYRYQFSDDFNKELYHFSKVHQYDDRKTFKEAWKSWCNDKTEQLNNEIKNHKQNGYTGDILDKMFKSARYYFRKKPNTTTNTEDKKKPRKQYQGFSREFLEKIDNHIIEQFKQHIVDICETNNQNQTQDFVALSDVSPAEAYSDFCKTHIRDLATEIQLLVNKIKVETNQSNVCCKEISDKIKKTYKNRFYNIRVCSTY